MQARFTAGLLVVGLLALAVTGLSAPPGPPVTRYVTLVAEPIACTSEPDGICLGFNGEIPGPTIDINLGDTLVVTLVNHYTRPVSWHVHGTALSASMDGIAAHPGTQLVESVAQPGGSFNYTVRAAYAGSWHYHDHVLGADGSEGVRRGLYGGLIVRNGAEARADVVFDAHFLDAGVNGGRGVFGNVTTADAFEVLVVGLGNQLPLVRLVAPNGSEVDRAQLGPGLSDRFHVETPMVGDYTLRGPGIVGRIGVT